MLSKKYKKRFLPLVLALTMAIQFLPSLNVTEVRAESSGTVGSNDALAALGIDSSQAPEGFDPDSVENPYGRNTIAVTPVKELYTVGLLHEQGSNPFGDTGTYNDSQGGQTRIEKQKTYQNTLKADLYGHEKWSVDTTRGIVEGASLENNIASGNTTVTGAYVVLNSGTHEEGARYTTQEYYTAPKNQTTNLGPDFYYAMSDVEAGNFDGNKKSHEGQIAMVYTGALSKNGGIYLRFGDAKGGATAQTP